MSLVPVYSAYINTVHYGPVIGWNNPITYNRTTVRAGILSKHVTAPYSETKNMRPLMAPNPFSVDGVTYYQNDGVVDGGRYSGHTISGTPNDYSMGGSWNLSKFLQVQMAEWNTTEPDRVNFIGALEARDIEDAWITTVAHYETSKYNEDIAAGNQTSEQIVQDTPFGVFGQMEKTPLGKPKPTITATSCLMEVDWRTRRSFYDIYRKEEGFIAFYDDPPVVELVTREPCHIKHPVLSNVDPADYPPMIPFVFPNGSSVEYIKIQPWLWEFAAERPLGSPIGSGQLSTLEQDGGHSGPGVAAQTYRMNNFPNQVAAEAPNSFQIPGLYDGEHFYEHPTDSALNEWQMSERPIKWKHDDPEFIGYVPYFHPLIANNALMEDYIANPDARFDGFRFMLKVRTASVTRSWYAHVFNRFIAADTEFVSGKKGRLEAYAWRDTRTNEIINEVPNCSLMTAISIGFSEDLVTNPSYPGFPWEEYEWPDPVITIPPGTFLIEDGNAAPIYPDFKGAYVYDMHLKKWGKFDGDYKRLLDYSAINTYMPNQQSFTRFGIFGGVLTADGKIRLFDDAPAVASITYGKIGYYRQGMTSLEEIRIHHRDFKTGAVRINSSIEGKLIEPSFTTTTNFAASSMWQVNGGYAAKWHTITVLGSFDLSYMEFRGIPAGRR